MTFHRNQGPTNLKLSATAKLDNWSALSKLYEDLQRTRSTIHFLNSCLRIAVLISWLVT
jgi:hypothetical protein